MFTKKTLTSRVVGVAAFVLLAISSWAQIAPIRPPAIPLIVRNPYVSTWQPADNLAGTWPAFWNGSTKAMTGIVRIDGTAYTFMGSPTIDKKMLPVMTQKSLELTPTQSRFTLQAAGVTLTLNFLSPVEPNDLRRLSVPFGYIFASANSDDGKPHTVSLYFDISGEWAHGDTNTQVNWGQEKIARDATGASEDLTALTLSPASPKEFGENNEYPMWGSAVVATAAVPALTTQVGADTTVRSEAAKQGVLDGSLDKEMPRAINLRWPVLGFNVDLGKISGTQKRSRKPLVFVVGHVRDPAVSYLGKPVPPLWKSYWPTWQAMLRFAYDDAAESLARADRLDRKIVADANRAGGPKYAAICALALRQAFGATEMVGTKDAPWMFMKEISSDGNISTVDVIYPAFPVFLYTNPHLLRLQLDPLFAYAETGGWPKAFAEHDIGSSYPNASGHNDGNEEDMPVEESANMLIMTAAYLRYAPKAEAAEYAKAHYKLLKQWAEYEVANGLDPALQNQTDDFTGFIKSSANLALKAIVGVGAMGQIAGYAGNAEDARHFQETSRDMIGKWPALAQSKEGSHLVLAYGQDATWSLKYNAYPDKVLGLNLVPKNVLEEEAKYYKSKENAFGIPLDGRHAYTKTDWEIWAAAATNDKGLRQDIVDEVYKFANTSNFRGAFSDWYDTVTGQQVGFVARPVIGGVFAILTVK